MDNQKIKAVIFDLGNVLINFDHMVAVKRISRFCRKNENEILGLFFASGVTVLFEEGKISAQDFFSEVKSMLGLDLDFERFLPIWNEIFSFTDSNRAVYRIAENLKGRYKLALLTNINELHFAYLREKFPVFSPFERVFTSFELGLTKPDPLIYQKAVSLLGISSLGEVFYTDDRPQLVSQARELGLKSAIFRNPEQLRIDLALSGIKVD